MYFRCALFARLRRSRVPLFRTRAAVFARERRLGRNRPRLVEGSARHDSREWGVVNMAVAFGREARAHRRRAQSAAPPRTHAPRPSLGMDGMDEMYVHLANQLTKQRMGWVPSTELNGAELN